MNNVNQTLPPLNTRQKWYLLLGGQKSDSKNNKNGLNEGELDPQWQKIDGLLGQLYGSGGSGEDKGDIQAKNSQKGGGLSKSKPNVARWLGDIREYFPVSTVKVLQQEAIDRLNLKQLIFEPEILNDLEPNISLVATILSLKNLIPSKTKETARIVVRKLVEDLLKKLKNKTIQAITGSLNKAKANYRPRINEVNWSRTIAKNLKHYQTDLQTIIPERLIGYSRLKRPKLKQVILLVDESGSMASSVVYASIFGAIMASVPALDTRFVAFDTEVADLSKDLKDPVELLFGTQLGGGTDIAKALLYTKNLIYRPKDCILILISDLYEGGNSSVMMDTCKSLINSGVNLITLLALDDGGKPAYDKHNAQIIADMGSPVMACTPDKFGELIAKYL
jgi:VWA domain containing CoxE-like protein